ncbi:mitochondrial protein Pet127-domain-containing protein [Colletotrichum navitas]|uniref:Mitochondrial protein Pet127-domain-containing protein n=1 Tax=Colletotrichum navitas TaxID=681940 RepID=A0AAD8QCA6_9PEZI|nr:mitochondrial protein Pet127-domain-containing protein [Colletotrichum navitas]KAK1599740.1 mitochondrial protein Pet127-domain-containing protein [Colletotrichum navitas]
MLRINPQRLWRLGTPYLCGSCRPCLSPPCRSLPPLFQSTVPVSVRGYSDSAKASTAPDEIDPTEAKPPNEETDQKKKSARAKTTRSRRQKKKKKKKKNQATPSKATSGSPSTTIEEPAGPEVIRQVFESLKNLEDGFASINSRLSLVQKGAQGGTITVTDKDSGNASKTRGLDSLVIRQTNKMGGRLKTIRGTLDVLKSVLNSQQIPLDHLAKRPTANEPLSKTAKAQSAKETTSPTSPTSSAGPGEAETSDSKITVRKVETDRRYPHRLRTFDRLTFETPKEFDKWTSFTNRLSRSGKTSFGAGAAAAAASAVNAAGSSSDNPSSATAKSSANRPAKRSKTSRKLPVDVQSVSAKELQLVPIEIPDSPTVPSLSYGLDRVLFNPGVYHMQDPRSRVYNFDPYLANIMPINEFDFNALKQYVTSSKDTTLVGLAAKLRRKYTGSTSSMTQMLSHFHYLLSAWRPINASNLSRQLNTDAQSFTQIMRAPAAAFLHLKDDVYAIDADKEYDTANILSMLGKSMEKLLTLPKDEFEKYRRVNSDQISEEERNANEAFHFTTMGDFLMRSQLDAHDPRLPGTGMFDLKTRAVVSIRMDAQGFQKGLGYEIRKRFGDWESFEREYFDMIRAAFLKYSLQVRMGRMDGIFVAFHNTRRIFGFQYVSLDEMDLALHGTENRSLGDQEFKLSLHLLNKVLDRATERFPGRSIRLHVETRPSDPPFMYVFAKPVTGEEIEKVQNSSKAAIAKFEQQILGLAQQEAEFEAPESEAEQLVSHEEASVSVDEATNQQRQTQAFWEEMQEKVDEAVEDDALGIGHVREAIQDALEQSGLLKARTPEEARWYVDGLLEALTPNQASEMRESDRKDDQQVETPAVESGSSTVDSAQADGLDTVQEATLTSGEETTVTQDASEAQTTQDGEKSSPPNINRQDSEVRGSRDLGLKDLILRVATRVDEKPEAEEAEMPDDDAASDVSKLRTFERILSELVAKSKEVESDSASSITSQTADPSTQSNEDLESTIGSVAAAAEAVKEAASDAGAKSEEADTELDISEGELLGMVVTVRNNVNGKYVPRPSPNFSHLDWSLEYSVEEIPSERAKTIYSSIQERRKKVLNPYSGADRERNWYTMFSGKLEEMSKKGKQFRKQEDALSKESLVHVVGEEAPMTWDVAFSHQKQWKPLSWDEPKDS